MALIIVIPTGDSQILWNVLSLSFNERENGKWPYGLSDFHHNCLISNDCIHHSGKIFIYNTFLFFCNNFLCNNMTFFVGF